jgi:hypothetical protein
MQNKHSSERSSTTSFTSSSVLIYTHSHVLNIQFTCTPVKVFTVIWAGNVHEKPKCCKTLSSQTKKTGSEQQFITASLGPPNGGWPTVLRQGLEKVYNHNGVRSIGSRHPRQLLHPPTHQALRSSSHHPACVASASPPPPILIHAHAAHNTHAALQFLLQLRLASSLLSETQLSEIFKTRNSTNLLWSTGLQPASWYKGYIQLYTLTCIKIAINHRCYILGYTMLLEFTHSISESQHIYDKSSNLRGLSHKQNHSISAPKIHNGHHLSITDSCTTTAKQHDRHHFIYIFSLVLKPCLLY